MTETVDDCADFSYDSRFEKEELMADKAALIREVFELCNGLRNFRIWLDARADQFAATFAKTASEKAGMKTHFSLIAEQKVPQWIDVVVNVYGPVVTEQELEYAKTELTKFRNSGITDPPDEAISRRLRCTLLKFHLVGNELDSRMSSFLEHIITTAWSAYQARN